jgi:RNA polymerase sigma-70 factor (ECF subfamily)
MDAISAELVDRWRGGDENAAGALLDLYAERLVALARSRLPAPLASRLDAEDVVQSVWRTFFDGAREGRFNLERSGDLWRLLAALAVQKTERMVEWHQRERRDVGREQPLGANERSGEMIVALAGEPTPDEAAALADEVEHLMRRLNPPQRQMLELRLQGYLLDEIAELTRRSQRTVRRLIDDVRRYLERRQKAAAEGRSRP